VIVDTNVYLSRWPFRRLPGDETSELVSRLRKRNVTQAWAGSFDGILHKDLAGVNSRLAAECASHGKGLLVPFGSINPKLPGWQDDLRRCREEHRMPGIRLHPNYHGYDLKDPVCAELFHAAAKFGMIVQIVPSMEDIRTQHPLMRVPPADLSPLTKLIQATPGIRVMLLNWTPSLKGPQLGPLLGVGDVLFDISTIEGIEGVARLTERVSSTRVVFGSNFPLFYFEAALMKMKEAGLTEQKATDLFEKNARRMLGR
jgi:predicted TIM-barrel fold metal-dependent hydrolase